MIIPANEENTATAPGKYEVGSHNARWSESGIFLFIIPNFIRHQPSHRKPG
jgi:hypothetical protein